MSEQALSIWHGMVDLPDKYPSAQQILSEVAWRHDMSVAEMLSPNRERRYARARWDAMHLLREMPRNGGFIRSLTEIGRLMGGMDHTTVLHGIRRRAETIAAKSDAKREAVAA